MNVPVMLLPNAVAGVQGIAALLIVFILGGFLIWAIWDLWRWENRRKKFNKKWGLKDD